MKKINIIGAGLSSLYAACLLSKEGYEVSVYEKNDSIGGRSRVFEAEGFKFDMGPSWYWMPELIDNLFEEMGEKREDYFSLTRLDPAYQVFWKNEAPTPIPADRKALMELFDSFEPNGGQKLNDFLAAAQKKYEIAVPEFLEKPGLKLGELVNLNVLTKALKLDVFKSVDTDVSRRFSSLKAVGLLNFPVLFLGEMPNRIPSLYTLMNYADMGLGTWYPTGGMGALAAALHKIAVKNGVTFHLNASVDGLAYAGGKVTGMHVGGNVIDSDAVLAGADYRFVEQKLVPKPFRRYSEKYWDTRRLAPSCLIFYLGIKGKVNKLMHHNLFFDEDLTIHGRAIYEQPHWPKKPLFYVCAPSKTDDTVAPEDCENLFVLVPIAPDLEDTKELRNHYFKLIADRIKKQTGETIEGRIIYRRDFCITDFKADYNAFKGNAYGLANTLRQTANLKPKITSRLKNLFFCGQLTVPGPGVPPALISGKIAAYQLIKSL